MSNTKSSIRYECRSGYCDLHGCKGHNMEINYAGCSDIYTITPDAGVDKSHHITLDSKGIKALIECLQKLDIGIKFPQKD